VRTSICGGSMSAQINVRHSAISKAILISTRCWVPRPPLTTNIKAVPRHIANLFTTLQQPATSTTSRKTSSIRARWRRRGRARRRLRLRRRRTPL
jgi:hypothetical protein